MNPEQHVNQDPWGGVSLPRPPIEHLRYQSLSEYACAKMLEKYCDWVGIPGVTFQVNVGRTQFDFRLGYMLIEYHPIALRRECATDALSEICSAIRTIPKDQKERVLAALAGELEAQYQKRRCQVASASPEYKDFEVICLSTPSAFCSLVSTLATGLCPPLVELEREFRKLQKDARQIVRDL